MGYFRNVLNAITGTDTFRLDRMTDDEVREFVRIGGGSQSISGTTINAKSAMRNAAANRCVSLVSGAIANMPKDLMKRIDERKRLPAVGHDVRKLLTQRPNSYQTPSQFFKMQTAWMMLRGNSYSRIVWVGKTPSALIPLSPDRMTVKISPSMVRTYEYQNDNGKVVTYQQKDILHTLGMSLDGMTGLSVISYMREALALAIDSEAVASHLMKNGTFADGVITHPGKMSKESYERLRNSWQERRQGIENAGKTAILEEGSKFEKLSMTASDLQFLEQRDFQRYDIAMFFGVPPHMIGATDKTTSWGSGIEQQNIGFVTYTLNDWIVSWEELIKQALLPESEWDSYDFRFFVQGLLKGDTKAQWDAFTKGRQWGIYSPNDVRSLLDMNPREDPEGDEYAVPPNQTVDQQNPPGDPQNDPQKP